MLGRHMRLVAMLVALLLAVTAPTVQSKSVRESVLRPPVPLKIRVAFPSVAHQLALGTECSFRRDVYHYALEPPCRHCSGLASVDLDGSPQF